jgi:hypothetical protein
VLAITVYSHNQLEQLLRGFNAAYNARRQRVLEGKTPDQVVAERLTAKPALAQDKPSGGAGPCDITKARLIAQSAKEVSQPDILRSVVVSDGKTLGDALSEAAEVLAPRLADRFQRLEAGGACMGVDADAFS